MPIKLEKSIEPFEQARAGQRCAVIIEAIAIRLEISACACLLARRFTEREHVESLLRRDILCSRRYLHINESFRQRNGIADRLHNHNQLAKNGTANRQRGINK